MRQRPKSLKPKAKLPVAPKSPKNQSSRARDLEQLLAEARQREADALKRESEALEQQTATSEILGVISSSPIDTQPVFDTIARNALRLCEGSSAIVSRYDGELMHLAAHAHVTSEGVDHIVRTFPMRPSRTSMHGRAVLEGTVVHVRDVRADLEYDQRNSQALQNRSSLAVPMLRAGRPVGAIAIGRFEVRPFSEQQIALLQTFADQAVIAIENVRLFNELEQKNKALTTAHAQVTETLDRQTATAEILRVISSSPTDVQPVFDAIASTAVRLCVSNYGVVHRFDGTNIGLPVAMCNVTDEQMALYRRIFPLAASMDNALGESALTRRTVQIEDTQAERRYTLDTEAVRVAREVLGYRTVLMVPMVRRDQALGIIAIWRREQRPFSPGQIALVETFADQAVIAIENVRLFKELETKNRELTTALDQQTATSEILRVISSSPTEVRPVFDAIMASAVKLCAAHSGLLVRIEDGLIHRVTDTTPDRETPESVRRAFPRQVDTTTSIGQAILERRAVQLPDTESPTAPPTVRDAARSVGFRAELSVPMLRDGEPIGGIAVTRRNPGLFSPSQVQLLQTFADQAVIAIENVRLFTELESRNRDLTATGEILQVISRSPTDAQPVFDTIADNAVRLFKPWSVAVYRFDGQLMHVAAVRGGRPGSEQSLHSARRPTRDVMAGRCIIDRTVIHVPDFETDPDIPLAAREIARARGFGATINVPMLRDGEPIGVISVSRAQAGPFSQAEIDVLQTFADQAVIAIANVRLFKELQTRTGELTRSVERLTALGEVGRAVSSTLDLETVLTTIVSRAVELSRADGGSMYEYDEAAEEFSLRASYRLDDPDLALRREIRIRKGEGAAGQLAVSREPVQIPDITIQGTYDSRLRGALLRAGARAVLAVPLLREEHLIGGLIVSRNAPGEFPPEAVELLRTFATQSSLAIQNARLFREIEEKSRQLEVASQHKSEFLANMSHELRTPLNAVIGFSEVLSDRMFGELNDKQAEYLKDIHASGSHLLSLINDILDLSKIEAGRMELELSDFHLPTALENALMLVRERAGRRSIALHTSIDNRLGEIRADERKIRQVVLNLLSNAIKFTREGGRIEVGAVPKDGFVEVSVSDTGVGIAPEDQDAIFEEFRQVGTAEKKAEGTGLGLTLCRKFIELHGGRIWVKSQVDVGSTFTFTIPVRHGE